MGQNLIFQKYDNHSFKNIIMFLLKKMRINKLLTAVKTNKKDYLVTEKKTEIRIFLQIVFLYFFPFSIFSGQK